MGEKDGEKKAAAEVGEKKTAAAEPIGGPKINFCAWSQFLMKGVEKVKVDCGSNKLTVTGHVDPSWLRERVEYKTKKKVELVSPQPKKDGGAAAVPAAGDKKAEEKSEKKPEEIKADDKKPKEPAVTTVVMKIKLHCDGCAHKIKRVVLKNVDGVNSVKTDVGKDTVTVTGTMDVKELLAYLKDKLKKGIEIVPPKKAEDSSSGPAKNEKVAGGDKKPEVGPATGGPAKEPKQADAAKESKPSGEESKKVEVNKLEYNSFGPLTHYAMPIYNQSYANQDYGLDVHHPSSFVNRGYANQGYANHGYHSSNYGYPQMGYVMQYSQGPPPPPPTYVDDRMFSDENPNGCSIM
ncbi:Heavy metal transport/detoxification superfamily protein [Striga hermonthica]|uniref:Heavy metal transport/detoxification superfamily protein n=1 Tax=Striga hermonthica TaxID=68872 RepID=A0A9N7NK35_STRHE|nr:Heavy metal transport/detoxification superfamily protein [Striga hermonthica]